MEKIKLAFVSPYPPSKGTLNEYAFHLVKHLKEKEEIEEIIIISDKLPEGESFPEIKGKAKVTVMGLWDFNGMFNFSKIRKAIKKSGANVAFFNIHFLSFGDKKIPATLGLFGPLYTKWAGVKSTVLLHNIVEVVDLESAGITKNPILKWFYNLSGTMVTKLILSANMVMVTIAKYVEILEAKYKVKNVALVPHGSFELPPLPEFRLPPGPKQVMTFGKFGTYKKVEGMIEAVEMIRKRTNEDIEIVVAGTDNPNVKGYLDEVQKKYSHVPNMRFTGYVEEEDVPKIFKESCAVVFPYTSTTGSSGVLHQAGSYGRAVVLPKIGDLKELVEEEGYVGEFFEPDDIEGMADAIEKLLVDEKHRNELGSKNYAAAASLPMTDIADWYVKHFQNLLKG